MKYGKYNSTTATHTQTHIHHTPKYTYTPDNYFNYQLKKSDIYGIR